MYNPLYEELYSDAIAYGTGFKVTGIRSWYNPMRWIKGKFYQKRINHKKMYIGS